MKELPYSYKPFLQHLSIPKKQYLISLANKPYSIKRLKQSSAKIVHLTHYDPYLLDYCKNKCVVSTMHDLNFFAIPQFYRKHTNILKNWQITCAEKSDRIITISENSKKDLQQYLHIPEEKITVIYHGINEKFKKTNSERIFEKPYILFVGRRGGYKNWDVVLNAFSHLHERYEDVCLVCTGYPFSREEWKKISCYHLEDYVVNMGVSEKKLINLYSHALFFVFPSFYEGFGFPLLEAMGCECPIICSNTSCFPEIVADAGLFFDPQSVDELTEKMYALAESETLCRELVVRGIERKTLFSWNTSRQKHFEVYAELEHITD